MGRPRRTMRRRTSARRRRRADWVYRPNILQPVDSAGGPIGAGDVLGTYEPVLSNLPAGTATGRVLYDSHNRFQHWLRVGSVAPNFPIGGTLAGAARAEGSMPSILATVGQLIVRPATWAMGTRYDFGFRVGIFRQDPEIGVLQVDTDYSMWLNLNAQQPCTWANDGRWVVERRDSRSFSTANDQEVRNYFFRWRGRRRLKPDECFGILAESSTASTVQLNIQYWCRTLVSDQGAGS